MSLRNATRHLVDSGTAMPIAVTNAGLVLDKFLAEPVGTKQQDQQGPRRPPAVQQLYRRVAETSPPPLYRHAYARWSRSLADLAGPGSEPALARHEFTVAGRLIVGLGAESVRETGITLHRLYGVPIIPGSALKGLARHYVHWLRQQDPAQADAIIAHARVLFGEQADAGHITYFDAWYVPDSAPGDRPLVQDVITVHHPAYYGSQGSRRAPWDFDDPNPTPFLSARGTYLIAVLGPNVAWAALARDLLQRALAEWGTGGKTSSGYGRETPLLPAPNHPLYARFQELAGGNMISKIQPLYLAARLLPQPARQQALLAIRAQLTQVNLLARWANREWVQALEAELQER